MTDIEIKLKALKWVRDWSICLIFIQTLICGGLYYPLSIMKALYSNNEKLNMPGVLVHFAWIAFAASIALSAFLLFRLPNILQQTASAPDEPSQIDKAEVTPGVSLLVIRTLQTLLFILGALLMLLFALFMPIV